MVYSHIYQIINLLIKLYSLIHNYIINYLYKNYINLTLIIVKMEKQNIYTIFI